jgi:hypothetical protein
MARGKLTGGFAEGSGRAKEPQKWITWHGHRFPIKAKELPAEEKLPAEFRFRAREIGATPAQEFEENVNKGVKHFSDVMGNTLATHAVMPKAGPLGHIATALALGNVAVSAANVAQHIRSSKEYYKQTSYSGEEKTLGKLAGEIQKLTYAKEGLETDLRETYDKAGQEKIKSEIRTLNEKLKGYRDDVKTTMGRIHHPKYSEYLSKEDIHTGPKAYAAFGEEMSGDQLAKVVEKARIRKEILDLADKVGSQRLAEQQLYKEAKSDELEAREGDNVIKKLHTKLKRDVFDEYIKERYSSGPVVHNTPASSSRIIEPPKKRG